MLKSTSSDKYQTFLTWLKNQRQDKGLTMREVAEIIDEPHQFISKIETGERRLDVFEYIQYCQALGINPTDGLKLLK